MILSHLLHYDMIFWLQTWRLCIESWIAVFLDMSLYMQCRSELSVTAALLHDVVDDILEIDMIFHGDCNAARSCR